MLITTQGLLIGTIATRPLLMPVSIRSFLLERKLNKAIIIISNIEHLHSENPLATKISLLLYKGGI